FPHKSAQNAKKVTHFSWHKRCSTRVDSRRFPVVQSPGAIAVRVRQGECALDWDTGSKVARSNNRRRGHRRDVGGVLARPARISRDAARTETTWRRTNQDNQG